MSLREYPELEQRSDEWLALRCGMVTASVVGQLVTTQPPEATTVPCPSCGVEVGPCLAVARKSPTLLKTVHQARIAAARERPSVLVLADNDTTHGLAALLAAERIAGPDPDGTFVNRDMWRGVEAEAPAREKYAEHYGVQVTECGFLVLQERGYRLGYSPDGLVGNDGLIEIKSPRRKGHLETVVSGEVPAAHVAQIQAGLLVSGRQWCDLVSFNGGMNLWVKRVLPDPEWHTAIAAAVSEIEKTVEQLVSDYLSAVEGFPMTERLDLEIVI